MDGFRPDIEGLRAVSVALVVLNHLTGHPAGGFVGVDVFFVISGYLITGLLVGEARQRGRFSFFGFYARRARRILPVAVVVLIAIRIAAGVEFPGPRVSQTVDDIKWALGFVANVHFADIGTDYFQATRPPSLVQHFWSLAVEEQYYLVWPIVLAIALVLARRRGESGGLTGVLWTVGVLTVASFVWSVRQTTVAPATAYFSTPARAWELGVGATLAVAAARFPAAFRRMAAAGGVLSFIGLAGVVVSAFVVDQATGFPAPAAAAPVLFAALVIAADVHGHGVGLLGAGLTNPVSRYLGRISYSVYLWHWPVILICAQELQTHSGGYFCATAVATTLALSIASYELVERPFRRFSFAPRRTRPQARPSPQPHPRPLPRPRPHSGPRPRPRPNLGPPTRPRPGPRPRPDAGRRHLPRRRLRASVAAALAVGILGATAATCAVLAPPPRPPAVLSTNVQMPVDSGSPTAGRTHAEGASSESDLAVPSPQLARAIAAAVRLKSWPGFHPNLQNLDTAHAQRQWTGCRGTTVAQLSRCSFGPPTSGRRVLVIGDSYAMSWLPAIRAALTPRGWRVLGLMKEECPAAYISVKWQSTPLTPFPACDARHAYLVDQVNRLAPSLVILASTNETFQRFADGSTGARASAEWQAGMIKMIRLLGAPGRQLVTLSPPPAGLNLQACDTSDSTPTSCTTTPDATWFEMSRAEAAAAVATKTIYVDTHRWFCDSLGRCPPVIGTTAVRWDGVHLTGSYARSLAPQLVATLLARHVPV